MHNFCGLSRGVAQQYCLAAQWEKESCHVFMALLGGAKARPKGAMIEF